MSLSPPKLKHTPGRNGYTYVYPLAMIPNMAMKDAGLRIRVERELRDAFRNACAAEHRDASEVLREFMRAFAEQRNEGRQASLFALPGKIRVKPFSDTAKSNKG